MAANRRRNIILTIAIVLTTVMMTTLFTSGGSIMRSVERNTMYQVGTSKQAGFKFLTQEEYDQLSGDPEVHDLSYNIIVGEILNEELIFWELCVFAAHEQNFAAQGGGLLHGVDAVELQNHDIAVGTAGKHLDLFAARLVIKERFEPLHERGLVAPRFDPQFAAHTVGADDLSDFKIRVTHEKHVLSNGKCRRRLPAALIKND